MCVWVYSLYRSNITILQCYTAILALLWEYNKDTEKLYAGEFSSVKLYNVGLLDQKRSSPPGREPGSNQKQNWQD